LLFLGHALIACFRCLADETVGLENRLFPKKLQQEIHGASKFGENQIFDPNMHRINKYIENRQVQ
jgi:hypothetical protein